MPQFPCPQRHSELVTSCVSLYLFYTGSVSQAELKKFLGNKVIISKCSTVRAKVPAMSSPQDHSMNWLNTTQSVSSGAVSQEVWTGQKPAILSSLSLCLGSSVSLHEA